MNNLSLDEITTRIVDAVLNEPILNKEKLTTMIRSIIKIWMNVKNLPKNNNKGWTKTSKYKLLIKKGEVELNFWKKKYKESVDSQQLNKCFDELDEVLKDNGLYKKRGNNK